jgi:hypothetical protein
LKAAILLLLLSSAVAAQRGGQNVAQAPAANPRAAAPIDLTGYWVSIIVDEWRFRVTPQKGEVRYLPINAEARRVALEWDPEKDAAQGNQCRGYGAVGVMQRAGRLHITWTGDTTLKIETDAGTQTRLLNFGGTSPRSGEATWQGYSAAEWQLPGLRGRRGAPELGPADILGRAPGRYGQLKVVTTKMKSGYIRKNGVPYSENAVLTEYFSLLEDGPDRQAYIALTAMVDDPTYLTQPFVRTYTFKKVPDQNGWDPTPCWTK